VHVGDRDVRLAGERLAQQTLGIAGQRHDLEPRLGEDPRDPLAQEPVILTDDDAYRIRETNTSLSGPWRRSAPRAGAT
jgi:hypothetical protein